MTYLHQISDEERAALIAFNQGKLDVIKSKMAELQKEAHGLSVRISELSLTNLFGGQEIETYDEKWSVAKKTEFVLTMTGYAMNTRKIAEKIGELDGGNHTEEEIRNMISSLSATLKQKTDKGVTFGRMDYNNEWIYGLIGWFDGEQLKEGYIKRFTMIVS
jgi:hypothetical protein